MQVTTLWREGAGHGGSGVQIQFHARRHPTVTRRTDDRVPGLQLQLGSEEFPKTPIAAAGAIPRPRLRAGDERSCLRRLRAVPHGPMCWTARAYWLERYVRTSGWSEALEEFFDLAAIVEEIDRSTAMIGKGRGRVDPQHVIQGRQDVLWCIGCADW